MTPTDKVPTPHPTMNPQYPPQRPPQHLTRYDLQGRPVHIYN
jgi:hypothetical protein